MIAMIDYDAGNIKSVEKALLLLGQEVEVTGDPERILKAEKVILPGVGAFGDAMENLKRAGLDEVIRRVAAKGTPFMGICLGLQLLFERSDEAAGRRDIKDPGSGGPEDTAYGMEFSAPGARRKTVSRYRGTVLCLFCTFILFEGEGRVDCESVHRIQHPYPCFG